MRLLRGLIALILVIALCGGFLLYVWPTPYRWDHVTIEGDTYPVRIHRLSGKAEMLTPDEGWVPMAPSDETDSPPGDSTT